MLTGSAYADDRHLRSRMAIYAYAETAADPRWRTSVIPWDGTQIVADVGCGNGFDLRQIVPQGRCRHATGIDLSAGMLRSLENLRPSGGMSLVEADAQGLPLAMLSQEFSGVTLRTLDLSLSIPAAQPVLTYVASHMGVFVCR
jgi:SAM-dependent methyltransferase